MVGMVWHGRAGLGWLARGVGHGYPPGLQKRTTVSLRPFLVRKPYLDISGKTKTQLNYGSFPPPPQAFRFCRLLPARFAQV